MSDHDENPDLSGNEFVEVSSDEEAVAAPAAASDVESGGEGDLAWLGSSSEEEYLDGDSEDEVGLEVDEEGNPTRAALAHNEANVKQLAAENLLNNPAFRRVRKSVKKHAAEMVMAFGGESSDSSGDELENRIGNVPLAWYDNLDHLGYDVDGKKVAKPEFYEQGAIDAALEVRDNPDFWRTITDPTTGKRHVLTKEELTAIRAIKSNKFAGSDADPFKVYTKDMPVSQTSWRSGYISKKAYQPSKSEMREINRLARALKKGYLKPLAQQRLERHRAEKLVDAWADEDPNTVHKNYVPPPKMKLPGHGESYNPPKEFVLSKEEVDEWNKMPVDKRPTNFLPKVHSALRKVPAFGKFMNDRFDRCLDLYLCPRFTRDKKPQITKESLLPSLPTPKDLQPFPLATSLKYLGANGRVHAISVDPTGQWLAAGGDDGVLRVYDVDTGRLRRTYTLSNSSIPISHTSTGLPEDEPEPVDPELAQVVTAVAWCPNKDRHLLAVTFGVHMVLINPGLASEYVQTVTDTFVEDGTDISPVGRAKAARKAAKEAEEDEESESGSGSDGDSEDAEEEEAVDEESMESLKHGVVEWRRGEGVARARGVRFSVRHFAIVKRIVWHRAGDYFACVCPKGDTKAVMIHQLSTRRTQAPFRHTKGLIQDLAFHPRRPVLFVATRTAVRTYNLRTQSLERTLNPKVKWVSSISVHPRGDHIVVGSYDKRVSWIESEINSKPFKTLKYHKAAVRRVEIAPGSAYPLFASASDDGNINVYHVTVADDFSDPIIVPVKILKGHSTPGGLGVMDICWHPSQPWLFSAGADGDVRVWTW